jgi:hypothetical protein
MTAHSPEYRRSCLGYEPSAWCAGISDRLRSPQRCSDESCACAYRPPLARHLISCGNPRQRNLPKRISDGLTNWSMKWVSNFIILAHLPFYARGRRRIEPSHDGKDRPPDIASIANGHRLPHPSASNSTIPRITGLVSRIFLLLAPANAAAFWRETPKYKTAFRVEPANLTPLTLSLRRP